MIIVNNKLIEKKNLKKTLTYFEVCWSFCFDLYVVFNIDLFFHFLKENSYVDCCLLVVFLGEVTFCIFYETHDVKDCLIKIGNIPSTFS